MSERVVS